MQNLYVHEPYLKRRTFHLWAWWSNKDCIYSSALHNNFFFFSVKERQNLWNHSFWTLDNGQNRCQWSLWKENTSREPYYHSSLLPRVSFQATMWGWGDWGQGVGVKEAAVSLSWGARVNLKRSRQLECTGQRTKKSWTKTKL